MYIGIGGGGVQLITFGSQVKRRVYQRTTTNTYRREQAIGERRTLGCTVSVKSSRVAALEEGGRTHKALYVKSFQYTFYVFAKGTHTQKTAMLRTHTLRQFLALYFITHVILDLFLVLCTVRVASNFVKGHHHHQMYNT